MARNRATYSAACSSPQASGICLCPGEPAAGGRRDVLVDEQLVVLRLLRGLVLHPGDLLRGQITGVLVLDLLDPGLTLRGFPLVELDLATAIQRKVDLLEECVHELRRRTS